MRLACNIIAILLTSAAQAETVTATRTLSAGHVIVPSDLRVLDETLAGYLTDPTEAYGLETRITIYAGRPISSAMLIAPAVVERNQVVPLIFELGGLLIMTEGRALARGAEGETIRVTNLSSRQTVFATVLGDGRVVVK